MIENKKKIPLTIHCPNCKSQIHAKYDMSNYYLDGECAQCGHTMHSYAPNMAERIQEKMRENGMTVPSTPDALQLVPEETFTSSQEPNTREQQTSNASGGPEALQVTSSKMPKANQGNVLGDRIKTDDEMEYKYHKCGAGKSTYIVFSIIWGIPSIPLLILAMRHPGAHGALSMMLLLLFAGAFIFVWIKSYRIEINGDKLIYNSLFGGRKTIHQSEIESARTVVDLKSYGTKENHGGTLPPIRLVITPKRGASSGEIIINMKVFDRDDLIILQKFLGMAPPKIPEIVRGKDMPATGSSDALQSDPETSSDNYSVGWGLAFILVLGFLGVKGIHWVVHDTYYAVASQSWSTVTGRVVKTAMKPHYDHGSTVYDPYVKYTYTVNGLTYVNHRISFPSPPREPALGTRKFLEKFPRGAKIPVHYDPDSPQTACLIQNGIHYFFVIGIGGISILLLLLSLGMLLALLGVTSPFKWIHNN